MVNLDEAISQARRQFDSELSRETKWEAKWWGEFRQLLRTRWEARHSNGDLHEIVVQDTRWFLITRKDQSAKDPNAFAVRLAFIGIALGDLYTTTRKPSDAAKSMFFRHYAFNLISRDKPNLYALLQSNYAFSLLISSEIRDNTSRLGQASEQGEIAASLTYDEDIVGSEIFGNLGNILRQKYLRFGDVSDLDRSIRMTKRSLTILESSKKDDVRGKCQDLCFSLKELFLATGSLLTLDEAIDMGWRSIEGPLSPEMYCDRVVNLTSALQQRYLSTLREKDATTSLELLYKSLKALPLESAIRAICYSSLVQCYGTIYGITGELQDLRNGIEQGEKGLQLRFQTWRSRSNLLNRMASLYGNIYKRTEEISDAHKAIQYAEASLDIIPEDDENYSSSLNELANIYDAMYMKTRNRDYLEFALDISVLSTENTPNSIVKNLNTANKFLRYYLSNASHLDCLERAAEYAERSLSCPVTEINAKMSALRTAGMIQQQLFKKTQKMGHFDQALAYLLDSYACHDFPSLSRIHTVRQLAKLLASNNQWNNAWKFLREAVEWIAVLCPTHLGSDDQQNIASELAGLSREACSAAIGCGKVQDALLALEQGRGIVVYTKQRANFHLERLQRDKPDLYSKYAMVRTQLSHSLGGVEKELGQNRTQSINRMKALTKQMDGIIEEIRTTPGFSGFLRSISVNEMQELAGTGSIVVLNNSELRNDAIIVQRDKIWSIKLTEIENFPSFTQNLEYMPTTLMNKIVPQRGQVDISNENSILSGLLQALWWHIGKPVTESLGLNPSVHRNPDFSSRHIRWMPTGWYSRVPIHAAGIWTAGTDKIMARGYSSYVSTFRMLKYAKEMSVNVNQQLFNGVIVSMERPDSAPGSSLYLPTARKERESILRNFSTKVQWNSLLRPAAADVLDQILDCSWLHVACHGLFDARDPSQSFLKLQKKTSTDTLNSGPSEDTLTVQRISEVTNHKGAVAFLSACSTAESRVGSLFDENLSIAYSFQLAGFPHVVASLWSSYDPISLRFAQYFYKSLAEWTADAALTSEMIAFAVSKSVSDVLKELDLVQEPLLWANFIHIGP